ncbi:hypothetical protein ACFQX6_19870 [Streptosporangium lutulentum]
MLKRRAGTGARPVYPAGRPDQHADHYIRASRSRASGGLSVSGEGIMAKLSSSPVS